MGASHSTDATFVLPPTNAGEIATARAAYDAEERAIEAEVAAAANTARHSSDEEEPAAAAATAAAPGDASAAPRRGSLAASIRQRLRGGRTGGKARKAKRRKNKVKIPKAVRRRIKDEYKLAERIGEPGQFSYARKVRHKATGEWRVAKVIDKQLLVEEPEYAEILRREVEILRAVDHPNIVRFFEAFEDEESLYLVLEYCRGGELFDRIQALHRFSEEHAAQIMKSLLSALAHLHSKNIAHCDIKPANVLFADESEESSDVRIIDFGLSSYVTRRRYLTSLVGTAYYMAPEVIRGQYSTHADMWSLGVIVFIMLFGFAPFGTRAKEERAIRRAVLKGFTPEVKQGFGAFFPEKYPVSESARDFISRLLTMDVADRYSAEEAIEHPWLKGHAMNDPLVEEVLSNLRTFRATNKFKVALLGRFSSLLDSVEKDSLRTTFEAMDENGDGVLSVEEISDALRRCGGDPADAKTLVDHADLDGNGLLEYEEVLAAAVDRKLRLKEERMFATFREIDLDGDGKLTREEIVTVLGTVPEDAAEMLASMDANGDELIDYEEFASLWLRGVNLSSADDLLG